MRKIIFLLLALFSILACTNKQQGQKSDKQIVTVSILPQKYFVEKIVGNQFIVNVMIPPGASPVTYEPSPQQMKELSDSKVYLRIGHIEFEKSWMKKLQSINPDMKIIDLSKNGELIEAGHKHGDHYHYGVDPHIWTSPKEVKKQVEIIYDYFVQNYPELKTEFESNYTTLVNEIESIDKYINEKLSLQQGKKFLIFHPALSYLARDYGLEQISIEIDGKEPTPANIQEIIEIAKKEEIKVVFVQNQFSTHNAEVIANEIDGRVVQIDPLSYNWSESIKFIVDEIVKLYSN